ncbi:4a-hydroxytetrahydrobiopterin dehydratase [Streptomyces sp. Z26]|uniref:4a-hydroxytetrahydrobiopterin dehydratase n=1 Tax=Streptomyces TaxID=1883 RepID=UPI001F0C4398|nr:4a-hydroxytetrahydrobiopterin dehydratase [Streptomyces sp. Z26]
MSEAPVELRDDEIEARLRELPGWTRVGHEIARSFRIPFDGGVAMVVHVADVVRRMGHHADVDLRFELVRFGVTTRAAGSRLTEADFDVARRIDRIAAAHDAGAP